MIKIFKLRTEKTKENIYLQYADAMIMLCVRYVGNIADAEELINNGFMKVFDNMDNFKEIRQV